MELKFTVAIVVGISQTAILSIVDGFFLFCFLTAPRNRSSVSFQVQLNKLQMIIPQSLLPQNVTNLKQFSTSSLTLQETKSNVTALLGSFQLKAVATAANTDLSEAKVVKYLGLQKADDEAQDNQEGKPYAT